ncbi:MAG: hypothetical protein QOJ13_2139 [Gaiellales bacterium]|nr:hypothetical protein [Gaiellales bacterium]
MTLAEELERAAEAAAQHADPQERVAAVMAAEPGRGVRVYVVALEREETHAYLALDGDLVPTDDRRLVRDAVTMIGLAELAEEVSGAIAADELDGPFAEAQRRLAESGHTEAAEAAAAVRRALAQVASAAEGPRVATPGYLDRVGAAAMTLGAVLEAYRDHAARVSDTGAGPEVEAAWAALAAASRAGDPAGFAQAMTAAGGAVESLADDVLGRLRAPLV